MTSKHVLVPGALILCLIAVGVLWTVSRGHGFLFGGGAGASKPVVVFRYDDFSSKSPAEIDEHLIRVFQQRGLQCTFAVIPYVASGDALDPDQTGVDPLAPEKAELLKKGIESGAVEVALHGYSHRTLHPTDYTEFAGLALEEQRNRIAEGKAFLEERLGVEMATFVPPFNSYDSNTLRALETEGFSCISSALYNDADGATSIRFLPSTCGPDQLRDVVKQARTFVDPQPVIVCMLHPYSFMESGSEEATITTSVFDALLGWCSSQKDVSILSVGQVLDARIDLSAARFAIQRRPDRPWVPAFMKPPDHVYLSAAYGRGLRTGIALFYLAPLIVGMTLCFSGGLLLPRRFAGFIRLATVMSGVAFVLSAGYALKDMAPGWRGVFLSAFFLGSFVGVFVASRLAQGAEAVRTGSE